MVYLVNFFFALRVRQERGKLYNGISKRRFFPSVLLCNGSRAIGVRFDLSAVARPLRNLVRAATIWAKGWLRPPQIVTVTIVIMPRFTYSTGRMLAAAGARRPRGADQ